MRLRRLLHWLACALAAAAGATVVPIISLALDVHRGQDPPIGNSIDNAPYRAAVVLLALSPVFFALAAAYFAAIAVTLRGLSRLTLRWLLLANLPTCLVIGSAFARKGYLAFGLRDALWSFALSGGLFLVCLSLGSISWWAAGTLTSLNAARRTADG